MSKNALVLNKDDLLKLPHSSLNETTIEFDIPTSILNTCSYTLMSRDICETDDSVVQILPYITLIDIETNKIFTYERGSLGEEGRLYNKTSIGLGGHVEEQPSTWGSSSSRASNVAGVLVMNMIRELNEEVGLGITYSLLNEIQLSILDGDFRLIYSEQDQVSKHHLCLHYILYIMKKDLNLLEECIISPNWRSVEEIQNDSSIVLESWSKICLEFVKQEVAYGF